MHVPEATIRQLMTVAEGREDFNLDDWFDGGELTDSALAFFQNEFDDAKRTGLQFISGVEYKSPDGDLLHFQEFDHDVWRIAGCPTLDELEELCAGAKGQIETAFPYLFFSLYDDALVWKLRYF